MSGPWPPPRDTPASVGGLNFLHSVPWPHLEPVLETLAPFVKEFRYDNYGP